MRILDLLTVLPKKACEKSYEQNSQPKVPFFVVYSNIGFVIYSWWFFCIFINSFLLWIKFCVLVPFLIFFKNIFWRSSSYFLEALDLNLEAMGQNIERKNYYKQVLEFYFEPCIIFWFSIFSKIDQIAALCWTMYIFLLF